MVQASLSRDTRFRVVGLNYKDPVTADALGFLNGLGNPYDAVGVDLDGRTAIDWGVYGVPETFIVDRAGVVRYKLVGPIGPAELTALRRELDTIVNEIASMPEQTTTSV